MLHCWSTAGAAGEGEKMQVGWKGIQEIQREMQGDADVEQEAGSCCWKC